MTARVAGLIFILDAFFVVRVVLHLLFVNHPEYSFTSALSRVGILGAGAFGALDLLLSL